MEQTHPSNPIFLWLVPVAQVVDKAAMELMDIDVRAAVEDLMVQMDVVVQGLERGVLHLDTGREHIVRNYHFSFIIASTVVLVDLVQRWCIRVAEVAVAFS